MFRFYREVADGTASAGNTTAFPADTCSDNTQVSPEAGESVTFTNASRDALGIPIAAVFDPGDGAGQVLLDPGASDQHTYAFAGTVIVSLTATDSNGDVLTLSASGLPAFASFTNNGDGTGMLSLAPGFGDSGGYPSVQITAFDGDLTDSETINITVNDVIQPPVADAGGPYSVDEGALLTLNGDGSFHPEGNPLTYNWDLDNDGVYDDGSGVQITITFTDGGTYSVGLMVSDGPLNSTAATSVRVNDLGPTAVADWSPQPQEEGSAVSFTGLSASSPDALASWRWDFAGLGVSVEQNPGFVFPDDGFYPVSLSVTDDDGSTSLIGLRVTIINVSPTVDAGDDQTVDEDDTISSAGSFTDPGADSWTATVDYGDGSGVQPLSLNQDKTFDLGHEYANNGSYTVEACVTDDDGGSGCNSFDVTVLEPAVIIAPCSDDLLLSAYQTSPNNAQYVDITNVGGSTINIDGCSLAAFNVFTELSLGDATVALFGLLAPGETFRVGSAGVSSVDAVIPDGSMPSGPGGLSLMDAPPVDDGTFVSFVLPDNITGMVYLNTTMVFGVAHLRVPAHNAIYDCIYGGSGAGSFFGPFTTVTDCLGGP